MSKKFDIHGYFRGIKIKVNPVTGEANLSIPLSDLEEILTSAILYEYHQIDKYKKELEKKRKPPKYLAVEENLAYCKRYLESLRGLSAWAKSFLEPPEHEPKTKAERLKVVTEIRDERLLIDSIIQEALQIQSES
jgi:hypothetical protein